MAAETEIDEGQAWAEVLARWEDDASHRAFLARFGDLEGLARAGGRYRDVLAAHPGDAVALRWRDEIIRRATVAGLASLPRTTPPAWSGVPRRLRSAAIAIGIALFLGGLATLVVRAFDLFSRGAP